MRTLCLASILAFAALGSEETVEKQPNILLLIADDLGTDMLRPYKIGKDLPRTPNLNSFAKQSVIFRNAWSTPMCSPTRACIQTGRLGLRTGIGDLVKDAVAYNGLSSSEILIPELLDSATEGQYDHAYFGKWHVNHGSKKDLSGAPTGPDVVRVQGYKHFSGTIHNIKGKDTYFSWPKITDGVSNQSSEYATTATVDDFLSWQSQVQGPYFAVVAFHAPHTPLHAPPTDLHSVNLTFVGTPAVVPRLYYKAMVEALDTEIGRLLANLGPSAANTMIIFMADNGTPRNVVKEDPFATLEEDHSKGFAYEGGVNVPLYISGPLVEFPGSSSSALVHAVDIFATVADLAGIDLSDPSVYPPKRALDSKSLLPFLEDPNHPSLRRFNYTERFFENTVAGAQPDSSQLVRPPFCQPVVESTFTESAPKISICGQAIVHNTDNSAAISLVGASSNAEAFLLVGGNNPAPNPSFDGLSTLSPKPLTTLNTASGKLDLKQPFLTDSEGRLTIPDLVHQKTTPTDFHFQFAIQDPTSLAWHISSAVRLDQTTNVKAVVDSEGYKLITHVSGGPSELYHLPTDPREVNDLLANGSQSLLETEREAYSRLRHAIEAKLDSVAASGEAEGRLRRRQSSSRVKAQNK